MIFEEFLTRRVDFGLLEPRIIINFLSLNMHPNKIFLISLPLLDVLSSIHFVILFIKFIHQKNIIPKLVQKKSTSNIPLYLSSQRVIYYFLFLSILFIYSFDLPIFISGFFIIRLSIFIIFLWLEAVSD